MSSLSYFHPLANGPKARSRATLVLATALLGISVASSSLFIVLGGSVRESGIYLAVYGLISALVIGLALGRQAILKNESVTSTRPLIALRVACAMLAVPCLLLFVSFAYGAMTMIQMVGRMPPYSTIRAGASILAVVVQGIVFWGLAAGILLFMAVKSRAGTATR